MLSQSPSCSVHPLSLRRAPLVGRGLCSSLLVLLALGAVQAGAACDYTVTSTNDSGGTCTGSTPSECTLRQAILDSEVASTGDKTICFAESLKGNTITVLSRLPKITLDLVILGFGSSSAANGITISGGNQFPIFYNEGAMLSLNGLILKNTLSLNGEGGGGAIWNAAGTVTVENSTFSGNKSGTGQNGGAISTSDALTIRNCTFSGNTSSAAGGAIYIANNVTAVIENSTFSGNTAGTIGGAIATNGTAPKLTVKNSTFYDNTYTTVDSGTIYITAPASVSTVLQNNIIVGNVSSPVACKSEQGAVAKTNNNNLISSSTSDCLTSTGKANIFGANPTLTLLANNGGPTQTMAISSTSPAYNKGGTGCLSTDQRGVTRPQYGTCDIGAYEASALAGTAKFKITSYGQCNAPCASTGGTILSPDATYPNLSLLGVCWSYVNLKNITSPPRALSNVIFELYSISNNNWVLNTNTIPTQGPRGVVPINSGPGGSCPGFVLPETPVASGSTLGVGESMTIWYKVGIMTNGTYKINTRMFVTDTDSSAVIQSSNGGNGGKLEFGKGKNKNKVVGEYTLSFNPDGSLQEQDQEFLLKPLPDQEQFNDDNDDSEPELLGGFSRIVK